MLAVVVPSPHPADSVTKPSLETWRWRGRSPSLMTASWSSIQTYGHYKPRGPSSPVSPIGPVGNFPPVPNQSWRYPLSIDQRERLDEGGWTEPRSYLTLGLSIFIKHFPKQSLGGHTTARPSLDEELRGGQDIRRRVAERVHRANGPRGERIFG